MSSLTDWLVENEPLFRKTRLPSLYSDLAVQKNTNPEGYAANLTAWQAALTRAALAGQLPGDERVILQISDELLAALASSQYGRPSGLGLVIDEGVRNKKMIEFNDFLSAEPSIYHKGWLPSPWSILRWGLQQAGLIGTGSYNISGRLRSGHLVLVQALEDISRKIIAVQEKKGQGLTDRILSRETFMQDLQSLGLESDQDMAVILRFLSRDKQALSYDSRTIKFRAPDASQPEPITSEDYTIVSLKNLISNLSTQVTTLERKITTLQTSAQAAVKSGNKQSALSTLKSKKLAEKTLHQRTNTLNQLEETFTKIEQAIDQVQIVQAMEASGSVLRSLNNKVGSVDRVEDVVENLREQMSKVDEVGQVLQEPLDGKMVLDEAEVDDELEEMERDEERKREEREVEVTRRRLQALDAIRVEEGSKPKSKARQEVNANDLEKSTEQLQRMSIEEARPAQGKEHKAVEQTS